VWGRDIRKERRRVDMVEKKKKNLDLGPAAALSSSGI
jgi:hypothetical protein